MSDLESQYKQALELDFIKFASFILLAHFLKSKFTNPKKELDAIMNGWSERIDILQTQAIQETDLLKDEEPDVANILANIYRTASGTNRDKIIQDIQQTITKQLTMIIDLL